jgi:hypothetical protein
MGSVGSHEEIPVTTTSGDKIQEEKDELPNEIKMFDTMVPEDKLTTRIVKQFRAKYEELHLSESNPIKSVVIEKYKGIPIYSHSKMMEYFKSEHKHDAVCYLVYMENGKKNKISCSRCTEEEKIYHGKKKMEITINNEITCECGITRYEIYDAFHSEEPWNNWIPTRCYCKTGIHIKNEPMEFLYDEWVDFTKDYDIFVITDNHIIFKTITILGNDDDTISDTDGDYLIIGEIIDRGNGNFVINIL